MRTTPIYLIAKNTQVLWHTYARNSLPVSLQHSTRRPGCMAFCFLVAGRGNERACCFYLFPFSVKTLFFFFFKKSFPQASCLHLLWIRTRIYCLNRMCNWKNLGRKFWRENRFLWFTVSNKHTKYKCVDVLINMCNKWYFCRRNIKKPIQHSNKVWEIKMEIT